MTQPDRRLFVVRDSGDAPPLTPDHSENEELVDDEHARVAVRERTTTPALTVEVVQPTRVWTPQRTVDLVTRRVENFRSERGGVLRVAARATRSSATYGSIGLGRAAGAWWRWVRAYELDQNIATRPDMVLAERKRRRTITLWTAGGGAVSDLMVSATMHMPMWALPAGLLGAVAAVGGVAEWVTRRSKETTEAGEVVRGIGTNPSGKAVRRLFVAAKLAKSIDEVKIIAPGVVRDGNAWTCEVELPDGGTYDEALKKRTKLAASSGRGVSRLYIDPVNDHEGRVRLWSPDRDPLSAPKVDCELKGRTTPVDVWTERVPLGLTVRGAPMGFTMPGRSWLVGGEPEAGKSVACNILLCFAALDPTVDLWLADGKGVDLLDYEDLAYRAVLRPDPEAVLEMIEESIEDMEERGAQLAKLRVKKLTKELAQELGWSMSLLHIDELAYFTTQERDKLGEKITEKLRDHVSRGRYVGKFTSAATQRPSGKVVNTELRDLLSIRLALRCNTPQASDMILGQGWAGRGHNAQLIDASQRGSGLLFAEGSMPVTGRTGFLDDPDVTRLSRVAYGLRRDAGTLPLTEDSPQRRLLHACIEAMAEAEEMWTQDLLPRVRRVAEFAALDDMSFAARLAECRPEIRPKARWLADAEDGGKKKSRNGYARADFAAALERRR